MSEDVDVATILSQYLEYAVKSAKGNVITFSAGSILKTWCKRFSRCRSSPHIRFRLSKMLKKLALCGLLQAFTRYRYRLTRESSLWKAAEAGNVAELLKSVNCYAFTDVRSIVAERK